MGIGKIVDQYARKYSPYMSGLVNHLPMGQLALYQMGNDLNRIKAYSEEYIRKGNIDLIRESYEEKNSVEECVGNRDLYEPCLDLISKEIESKGMDKMISNILNDYPLGLSSGLFHTTIRLAYAVEGIRSDKELEKEVARALAYYITAYRKADRFYRQVSPSQFKKQVKMLLEDENISSLIAGKATMGQKMKALYDDERYLEIGPVIEGDVEDKVKGLLDLLLPLLDKTNNIAILHCITGLHALLVVEEYFEDFIKALDIMTTSIITHLLTVKGIEIDDNKSKLEDLEWKEIIEKASKSSDVHTIKFTYTAKELYDVYKIPELKQSAIVRNF